MLLCLLDTYSFVVSILRFLIVKVNRSKGHKSFVTPSSTRALVHLLSGLTSLSFFGLKAFWPVAEGTLIMLYKVFDVSTEQLSILDAPSEDSHEFYADQPPFIKILGK